MEKKLDELKARLREIDDLHSIGMMLGWDQSTYMPRGGAAARARQSATLGRIIQEKFTDAVIGHLLDALMPYAESLPHDSDDGCLIRLTRRLYDKRICVPPDFTEKFSVHSSESYQAWTEARPANDFATMQPYLEKSLEFSRQYADFFPGYEHVADPMISDSDYGMTAVQVQAIFSELRQELVPLVKQILQKPAPDTSCLFGDFSEDAQIAFSSEAVEQFGYDFSRGRVDKTHHPFATKFSIGDVRITTRGRDGHLGDGIFATFHEAGHGMYEQGADPRLEGTLLASIGGKSSAMHESQSRLWENNVGRSRNFWQHYFPKLQAHFAGRLDTVDLETFYRAINKVEQSLIRVSADECTYNLHIMIRFDLELALLSGELAIRDLPAAWRERYQRDLGVAPPDDKDGVMQDVHWYAGMIGGSFQGYALGNILNAQIYEAASQAHPSIPGEIANGHYTTLHSWLTEQIYQHGAKFTAPEMTERITGGPIRIAPYMAYLRRKFGEIYGV